MCSTCGNMWYLGTRESPWDSPRRQRESSHKDSAQNKSLRGEEEEEGKEVEEEGAAVSAAATAQLQQQVWTSDRKQ